MCVTNARFYYPSPFFPYSSDVYYYIPYGGILQAFFCYFHSFFIMAGLAIGKQKAEGQTGPPLFAPIPGSYLLYYPLFYQVFSYTGSSTAKS